MIGFMDFVWEWDGYYFVVGLWMDWYIGLFFRTDIGGWDLDGKCS